MLKGKKIVIGITGSIAAYKIPFLIRLLVKEGAEVKVIMTPVAVDFVTPLTLSTLSKNSVIIDPFKETTGEWNNHVELGTWADVMIFAPVTANTLGKMANGIADNFVVTAYLSAKCPVFIAPAMDLDMYNHPSTQKNISILRSYGNSIIEPQTGELASGLSGPGRMEEPEKIIRLLEFFFHQTIDLKGKKVLVTAGPTFEAIDPVRFIGNHSSGRMGIALADEAARRGAEVTLIHGPVSIEPRHSNVHCISVVSSEQMYEASMKYFAKADITLMAAAVADFTPERTVSEKIKKSETSQTLLLKPTKDILFEMGRTKKPSQILVGFALETNNEITSAKKKLQEKNLDLIVLNSLKDPGAGFNTPTNKVSLITNTGKTIQGTLKDKGAVASDILDVVVNLLSGSKEKSKKRPRSK